MYVDSMHVLNHTLLIQTFLSVTHNASLTFRWTRFQIIFTCSQLLVVSLGSAVLNTMQIYQHQHHNPWDVNCTFTIATASAEWASYQIRKIASCACTGNAGSFSRHWLQREHLVSDPDMHHGTCFARVPCCMSRSLSCGGGENVPGIPGVCAPDNFTYLVRGSLGLLVAHILLVCFIR